MIQIVKLWILAIITSMLFSFVLSLLVLTSKYSFIQYITGDSLFNGFLFFFFFYIKYIHYIINKKSFSFLGFLMSILNQILLILVLSKFIYMINNQNYITIEDDKSLQYISAIVIFILMISIFFIKAKKDGLKKIVLNTCLSILSFYLLRLNLIFILPMILPAFLAQQVMDILSTKVNLIRYIFEDILKLKFLSKIKLLFWYILQLFLPSPKILDCHINSIEWCWHYRTVQVINTRRTTSLQDLDKKPYLLGSIIYNPYYADLFQNMKLNGEEIKGLLFLLDKWSFMDNVVTLIGSSPQVVPMSYKKVLFDFYNYPNGCDYLKPFPYSKDFTVPLYGFIGKFKYIEDIAPHVSQNFQLANIKEYLIVSIYDSTKGVWPEAYEIAVYTPMNYAHPSHINDWDANNLIYVKMDAEHYVKYNPNNVTDDMMNKKICLKTSDNEMIETIMYTPKLYKPFESATNIKNSHLGYRVSENSSLMYATVKSEILRNISWNDVDWTDGSVLNSKE